MKNLGPLATEHLTALYNDFLKSYRLPPIWKTSLVIPIPKLGKDSSQGTSYRPISLICPAVKVLEALIFPSINEFISPAKDQHGFKPRHSTTSSFLKLTTVIETGFDQRKPPHRTVYVTIDLTAAFDTVSHCTLISKIDGSSLPPAITRWLSCYLRGRDKMQLALEVSSRARKSSPPAFLKDPDRFDKRNNMLKALAGPSCGHDKETSLLTYNALGKSIASYAAPVWSMNASDSSLKKIQTAQNAALMTATGAHNVASIDHLHQESLTLKVGPLRYAFSTVPCKLSGGGPRLSWHHISRPKAKTYEGDSQLQTSLNCSS